MNLEWVVGTPLYASLALALNCGNEVVTYKQLQIDDTVRKLYEM